MGVRRAPSIRKFGDLLASDGHLLEARDELLRGRLVKFSELPFVEGFPGRMRLLVGAAELGEVRFAREEIT